MRSRAWLLRAWAVGALLSVVALWALLEVLGDRGFAIRDEAMAVSAAQRFVSSGIWGPSWSCGSFLRLAAALALKFGRDPRWLHAPVCLALVLELWALARLARRLGGPLVAQGAVLAAALNAAALLQSRSLLPFAVTPALLLWSVELAFQGRRRALLGGALLALACSEYEGAFLALPGLALLLGSEQRLPSGRWRGFLLGALLAFPALFWLNSQNWQDWLRWRLAHNLPGAATGESSPFILRLWNWVQGGEPNPYLGVWHHASFALWALPFVAAGLVMQCRRRAWLAAWIAGGLAGLLPAAFIFEPHRTVAAVPALCLAAGFGWAWAWSFSKRLPWLGLALAAIPILGLAFELRAFDASMRIGDYDYERSHSWILASREAPRDAPLQAGLLPLGRALEAVWGPRRQGAEWVWVPTELAADAPAWPGRALLKAGSQEPADFLALPPAGHPLLAELSDLRQFWDHLPDAEGPAALACRQALEGPDLTQPLSRAAVWSVLLRSGILSRTLRPFDLEALERERLKSVLLYRNAALFSFDLRLNYRLSAIQRAVLGEKSLNAKEKALLAQPWENLPLKPGAPDWGPPAP